MNVISPQRRPPDPSRDTVREWLAMLARLVAPAFPGDAAEAFAAYAPMLADYPADAFNRDTLADAAKSAKDASRIPTFAEVASVLDEWRAERRPILTRGTTPIAELPAPERITPEQADATLAAWGWRRDHAGTLHAPFVAERPADAASTFPDVALRGDVLAEARRRAGIRTAPLGSSGDGE